MSELTLNAQGTQLGKVVVVQVGVDAEQPSQDGLYGRMECAREGYTCDQASAT